MNLKNKIRIISITLVLHFLCIFLHILIDGMEVLLYSNFKGGLNECEKLKYEEERIFLFRSVIRNVEPVATI